MFVCSTSLQALQHEPIRIHPCAYNWAAIRPTLTVSRSTSELFARCWEADRRTQETILTEPGVRTPNEWHSPVRSRAEHKASPDPAVLKSEVPAESGDAVTTSKHPARVHPPIRCAAETSPTSNDDELHHEAQPLMKTKV